jgi:hypothetical protein
LTYQAGLLPFAPTFPGHFPQQLDGSKHQPNTDIHGCQFTAFISSIMILLVNKLNEHCQLPGLKVLKLLWRRPWLCQEPVYNLFHINDS